MEGIIVYFQNNWVVWLFGILNILITLTCRLMLKAVRQERNRNVAIMRGTKALLRSQILNMYNHYYEEKEYFPIYARENVEELYRYYSLLGGNGTITQLIEKMRELPTEGGV